MTDILIVGGGIAGLSLGAQLAPHAAVTVLEAEEALGYHASGRSAALYEPNYGNAPVRALSHAGREVFETGGYLSPRGLLIVARPEDAGAFDADMADLGCARISVDEARGMVPILSPAITRAAFHADAQDIDTDRLLQDYARTIRQNGSTVSTGARVVSISHTGQHWTVRAGDAVYEAGLLVNAAGAWADALATLAGVTPIGITPLRRSMARIPAPGGHDVSGWPMFFGPGERWYAKPDAGKLLVSPADETPVAPHDAWADDMDLAEGIDRYQAYVTPQVQRVETSWAGLRSFAPDRSLVLGRDPNRPDFIWCAGQGGYGFQTAPGAARYLADIVLGRPTEIPADIAARLDPARF